MCNGYRCSVAAVVGLRERKKARTRRAIVEVARSLFLESGYDGTTLADIAAAADVAPGTVRNYFATKADIVFSAQDEAIAALVDAVQGREPGTSALAPVRQWLSDPAPAAASRRDELPGEAAWLRGMPKLVSSSPELSSAARRRYEGLEEALERALAVEVGEAPAGVLARMVAAALLFADDDPKADRGYLGRCIDATARAVAAVPA